MDLDLEQYVQERSGPSNPWFMGDPNFILTQLIQDSERLFREESDTSAQVVFQTRGDDNSNPEETTYNGSKEILIDGPESLASFLQENRSREHNVVFRGKLSVLRQNHSWDKLLITREILVKILRAQKVFLPFLDCVHSFGFRLDEDTEVWEGLHRRYTPPGLDSLEPDGEYEICYTYRYVTCNGRSEGPTWSVRQTAVYEKRNLGNGCSTWILIQPSDPVWKRFKTANFSDPGQGQQEPSLTHCMFLASAVEGWKGYVSQLRQELLEISEKAQFVRLNKKRPDDFVVSFSDAQKLQRLRTKLLRALLVLQGQMDAISGVETHFKELNQVNPAGNSKLQYVSLDGIKGSVKYYRSVLKGLLDHSEGTASLLRQIVEYRLTEDISNSSRAQESSMLVLRSLTSKMQADNEGILKLAEQSQKDGIRVKTLTVITIFYLPATLIATIFSSNLVNTVPTSQALERGRLVIAPEFWIYLLITVGFTAVTLAVPKLLESGNRKCW
ncbi:hypothetical protein QBC38DRAFT_458077 [Podospora fimiseda]|uniref:CorA-like transporter domain-containing protein n=1 Tax=Podospora fimiseda TaxID=252190 RepID=A0AAN7BJY9_9PEZI|nr:hypothetical protein QBC38DRAFT_458077 [Podospora fimiseda]